MNPSLPTVPAKINLSEYERVFPTATFEGLQFNTPNSACLWRVQTLRTKEPDTFAWIEALPADAVFFDIGANMGQYAMLAAKRGIRTHAFEPESQNFALLCRNIALNNLGEKCTPWPIALSNATGPALLHVGTLAAGSSCHTFGESVSFAGEVKTFPFSQGAFGMRLGSFCGDMSLAPTHIKLDVDGIEPAVIEGIGQFALQGIRSLIIEVNSNMSTHRSMVDYLVSYGFAYDEKQAVESRRTDGAFKGVGNVVFNRLQP